MPDAKMTEKILVHLTYRVRPVQVPGAYLGAEVVISHCEEHPVLNGRYRIIACEAQGWELEKVEES